MSDGKKPITVDELRVGDYVILWGSNPAGPSVPADMYVTGDDGRVVIAQGITSSAPWRSSIVIHDRDNPADRTGRFVVDGSSEVIDTGALWKWDRVVAWEDGKWRWAALTISRVEVNDRHRIYATGDVTDMMDGKISVTNGLVFFPGKRVRVARPHGTTSAKRVVSDFPHSCPRCGSSAYVGLFMVQHADEGKAKSCPARRD